jgi:hypothetical protein
LLEEVKMAYKNRHIAKLDPAAVRDLLVGFRNSYRGQLDSQAQSEKKELREQIRASYSSDRTSAILDRIPKTSEEAKARILADVMNAAALMADEIPRFTTESRDRREGTRALMRGIAQGYIGMADDICNLFEFSASHIEARLALRAPTLLDLLISVADSPELLPSDEIGPYLLRHLHTRDDIEEEEKEQITTYGNSLAPWQLGMVRLMLTFHSTCLFTIGDLGPVRQGERGAPPNAAERNAFAKCAASWDRELGTKLLSPKDGTLSGKDLSFYNRNYRPYRKFLRFCEAAFADAIALYKDNCKIDSAVRTAIGHKQRKLYVRKKPTS